ncbi:MAG: hypothetical protein R3F20_09095 [Planctomycetota bacterium]
METEGRSPDDHLVDAEHELWRRWQRVASGEVAFDMEALLRILEPGSLVVSSVLALLAERGVLSGSDAERLLALTSGRHFPGREIARDQLSARALVDRLRSGEAVSVDQSHEVLLRKGASWAVIEVMSLLTADRRRDLVGEMERRKCFTRHQRHLVRCARADGGPDHDGRAGGA